MTEALRYNEGKPKLSEVLMFGNAIKNLAMVMQQGAVKYERRNWLLGGKPDEEYLDSAMRHITEFIEEGEVYDPESGCHHLAHAVWNLNAIQRLNYPELPSLDPEFDQAAFEARYSGSSDASAAVPPAPAVGPLTLDEVHALHKGDKVSFLSTVDGHVVTRQVDRVDTTDDEVPLRVYPAYDYNLDWVAFDQEITLVDRTTGG